MIRRVLNRLKPQRRRTKSLRNVSPAAFGVDHLEDRQLLSGANAAPTLLVRPYPSGINVDYEDDGSHTHLRLQIDLRQDGTIEIDKYVPNEYHSEVYAWIREIPANSSLKATVTVTEVDLMTNTTGESVSQNTEIPGIPVQLPEWEDFQILDNGWVLVRCVEHDDGHQVRLKFRELNNENAQWQDGGNVSVEMPFGLLMTTTQFDGEKSWEFKLAKETIAGTVWGKYAAYGTMIPNSIPPGYISGPNMGNGIIGQPYPGTSGSDDPGSSGSSDPAGGGSTETY